MWKFHYLPLHKMRIYPTLLSYSVLPFLFTSIASVGTCVARSWQWSFHLISITTPDWMGLWIPSPNLPLLHKINWFYVVNLTDLQKGKKIISEVVAKRCSAKTFSPNFNKINRKTPVPQSLSNTVKALQAVRLETLLKRDPVLVFRNQPVVDPLRNRCSWLIHKIHSKIPMLESFFE